MSPDAGQEARLGVASDPITVHVEHHARGWQVALSNQLRRVTCETFDDTRRIAHLCAAHTPCELIVHYTRDRPASHELIEGHHTRPQEGGHRHHPMPG
jgi:hypothetical protein